MASPQMDWLLRDDWLLRKDALVQSDALAALRTGSTPRTTSAVLSAASDSEHGATAGAPAELDEIEARLLRRIECFPLKPEVTTDPRTQSCVLNGESTLPNVSRASSIQPTHGERIAALQRWVVVGDTVSRAAQVGHLAKHADAIAAALSEAGREVHRVNPRDKSGGSLPSSLRQLGTSNVDVVNLTVNPTDGLTALREAVELGITKVSVTPGAGSNEIVNFCLAQGLDLYQGCLLTHDLSRALEQPVPNM